ncbi:MAG TPA: hypothetical protein VFE32_21455 [Puia sp.]|jgi:hypothetical protein|nr:hypothetical protein [Puia sp.]
MKPFLVFLLLCGTLNTLAQINWSKTSNWKIYKVPEPVIFKIPIDSLNQLYSRPLRQDSTMMYIGTSTILPDSIKPVWMGGWVATYELSGQMHKIQISAYGAFFYDQSSDRFYQIPIALKDDWMTYINQLLSSI